MKVTLIVEDNIIGERIEASHPLEAISIWLTFENSYLAWTPREQREALRKLKEMKELDSNKQDKESK